MKEFNLELAKEGKPICTRDGKDVRIICLDRNCEMYGNKLPIVALIKNNDEELFCYEETGRIMKKIDSPADLFMKSEEKTYWINIYKLMNRLYAGGLFLSKEEAELKSDDQRPKEFKFFKTISFTVEE